MFVDFNLEAGVSDRSIVRGFSLVVVLLLDGLGRLFLVVCLSLFFLLALESAISCSVVILVWVGIDAEDEEDEREERDRSQEPHWRAGRHRRTARERVVEDEEQHEQKRPKPEDSRHRASLPDAPPKISRCCFCA